MKDGVKRVRAWLPMAVAVLLLLLGLVVILLLPGAQETTYHRSVRVAEHFAVALMIAGLVGLVLETQHFTSYFESRLAGVLKGKGFIELLKPSVVDELQENITVYLAGVELNQETRALYDKTNDLMLQAVAGIYRDGYVDDVVVRDVEGQSEMFMIHSITSYELVSPRKDDEVPHLIEMRFTYLRNPEYEGHYLANITATCDDKPVEMNKKEENVGSELVVACTGSVNFKNSAHVRIETDEFCWKKDVPAWNLGMKLLTRNATIVFRMETEQAYRLEAKFFGYFQSKSVEGRDNAINVSFPDWALPKNGAIIFWYPEVPSLPSAMAQDNVPPACQN